MRFLQLGLAAITYFFKLTLMFAATESTSTSPFTCPGSGTPSTTNQRPQFQVQVTTDTAGINAPIELRLCIAALTSDANTGLMALQLDSSLDGSTFTSEFTLSPGPASCPSPWVYDAASSSCTAPFGPGCHSVSFLPSSNFAYIRGSASGVQFGSTCAFGPSERSADIDGNYVDGLSITYTSSFSRVHLWTYAAGSSDNAGYSATTSQCGCPCTSFSRSSLPAFLGSTDDLSTSYYCDTGYHDTSVPGAAWLTSDALWDMSGALSVSSGGIAQCVAEQQLLLCATPSNTPTISVTASITTTISYTPTVSVTISYSATVSGTSTRTISPTITSSATVTETRSGTHTVTQTITSTATYSVTASSSASTTSSATSTPSFSVTRTVSRSTSQSVTPSDSGTTTVTQTVSCSTTRTTSATLTSTQSATYSTSASVSTTPSASPSVTVSRSFTFSVTASISITPSASASATITSMQQNRRPLFTIQLPVGILSAETGVVFEMRLCIGSTTQTANIGLRALQLETSANGVYYSTVFDLQPSVNSCPSPWIYDSVSSTCTAPFGPGCHTVSVLSSASFAYIRGSASAVQFGATCAFGPTSRPSTIDDNYVDGLSITYTTSLSRNHVWTYAIGSSDNAAYALQSSACGCPCTSFSRSNLPAFLGSTDDLSTSYYCDTGYHGTSVPGAAWLTSDALWDMSGALSVSSGGITQCVAEQLPFVYASTTPTATASISVSHTCTPSITASQTSSLSWTSSNSWSPSSSASMSMSRSLTSSASASASFTSTTTATASTTASVSGTTSSTKSTTMSTTLSRTSISTPTPSCTTSLTGTVTSTTSSTATTTASISLTASVTARPSVSSSISATQTPVMINGRTCDIACLENRCTAPLDPAACLGLCSSGYVALSTGGCTVAHTLSFVIQFESTSDCSVIDSASDALTTAIMRLLVQTLRLPSNQLSISAVNCHTNALFGRTRRLGIQSAASVVVVSGIATDLSASRELTVESDLQSALLQHLSVIVAPVVLSLAATWAGPVSSRCTSSCRTCKNPSASACMSCQSGYVLSSGASVGPCIDSSSISSSSASSLAINSTTIIVIVVILVVVLALSVIAIAIVIRRRKRPVEGGSHDGSATKLSPSSSAAFAGLHPKVLGTIIHSNTNQHASTDAAAAGLSQVEFTQRVDSAESTKTRRRKARLAKRTKQQHNKKTPPPHSTTNSQDGSSVHSIAFTDDANSTVTVDEPDEAHAMSAGIVKRDHDTGTIKHRDWHGLQKQRPRISKFHALDSDSTALQFEITPMVAVDITRRPGRAAAATTGHRMDLESDSSGSELEYDYQRDVSQRDAVTEALRRNHLRDTRRVASGAPAAYFVHDTAPLPVLPLMIGNKY